MGSQTCVILPKSSIKAAVLAFVLSAMKMKQPFRSARGNTWVVCAAKVFSDPGPVQNVPLGCHGPQIDEATEYLFGLGAQPVKWEVRR